MGYVSSLPCLEKYINDPSVVVRETVEIAIPRIQWAQTEEGKAHKAMYDNPPSEEYVHRDFRCMTCNSLIDQLLHLD